uniref:Uncharacterized protein n=1 Tax=Rhizophora mucronata TaxID=61149 RepID=A0A2P2QYP9_RHIMU
MIDEMTWHCSSPFKLRDVKLIKKKNREHK